MTSEKFPLPGASYEELLKILSAYNHSNKPASPQDVSNLAGLHRTTVSYNHKFLVAISVLEGGQKKILTDVGRALAGAIDHQMEEEIRKNWRDIVLENEFLKSVVSAVRIRKGMELSTLQSHIAYSAGQGKTGRNMAGAGAIIEILREAGLLGEAEGKLIAIPEEETSPRGLERVRRISGDARAISIASGKITVTKPTPIAEGIPISIQIQIQCSAAEVENLASKIGSLIKQISNKTLSEDPEDKGQE
jgi:hypothetical protein